MFGFYILYLLYKSQTFRSKRERVSISLFKLSMRPVKTGFFETASVGFETANVRFETSNVRFETARRKLECKSQYKHQALTPHFTFETSAIMIYF